MKKLISSFILTAVCSVVFCQTASFTVNSDKVAGDLNYGSTGFLYGLGDPGIPSFQVLNALKPVVAAQKPVDGLQHPNGDAFKVAPDFIKAGGQKIQIYAQDLYKQWPYEKLGMNDYLPKLENLVKLSLNDPYHDYYEWVPLNEPDVIWYNDNLLLMDFCKDWEQCYNTIKNADPTAKVAGPNNTKYGERFFKRFMTYAAEHNCVPDTITWHELQDDFFTDWYNHYNSYRTIEKNLGISPRPIVINEYARFSGDLAMPGKLIQFISRFEDTQVNGCLAYWTTAGSLNDLVSQNTCGTGAWWLYKWYGELSGKRIDISGINKDCEGLSGLAVKDDKNNEITVLFGGAADNISFSVNKLSSAGLTDKVHIFIQRIGSSALNPSIGPETVFDEDISVNDDSYSTSIFNHDSNNAYLLVISKPRAALEKGEILVKQTENQKGKAVYNATEDGYYSVELKSAVDGKTEIFLNGDRLTSKNLKSAEKNQVTVFLSKGINLFEFSDADINRIKVLPAEYELTKIEAEDFIDTESTNKIITIKKDKKASNLQAVSFNKKGPSVNYSAKINAPEKSDYKVIFRYANGELGDGASNYNTNVVDRSAEISVNGKNCGTYFFRNTLGWSNFSTLVITLPLEKGENTLSFVSPKGFIPMLDSISIAKPVPNEETALKPFAIQAEAAGANSPVCPDPVYLSVRVRDDDSENISYKWTKKSGEGNAVFEDDSKADTSVVVDKGGNYIFECVVSDGNSEAKADVKVHVDLQGTYQAESKENLLGGTAIRNNSDKASGGKVVGYIGNGAENTLTFQNISADKNGTYKITIAYISGEDRTATLIVNDKSKVVVKFPSTGSWTNISTVTASVKLNKGMNSIKFTNPDYYAPDVDYIVVEK